MKRFMFLLIGFSFLMYFGCEKNTSSSEEISNDEQQILSLLDSDSSDLTYDAIDDGSEDDFSDDPNWNPGDGESLDKVSCDPPIIRFGRIARLKEKNIQIIIDSGDTTATAYIYKKLIGKFVVLKNVGQSGDTITVVRYEKPMTHEIERIVHLVKRPNNAPKRIWKWRIKDFSMADGYSNPDTSVQIVELTVTPEGMDPVVITDPLDFYQNGVNLFTFPRWTSVHLQVKVKNTSANPYVFPEGTDATELVLLHYGRNRCGHHGRTYFTWVAKEGDINIYKGQWTIKQFRGIHHAVIDVIDNGTIFESDENDYPYISNTWASPYRVTPF
ncbi:MAG: hypothetical protein K8R79_11555 [Calditrichales bacterium]|nr:hypothetical protein [Calditrichales bacterium]